MLFCPTVKMPDYFTRLLRGNMQPAGDLFRSLGVIFQDNPSLSALSRYCFTDIDPKGRLDFFIKNLGWHGLRNRLCSVFIFYSEHRFFPTVTNPELVDELLRLEEIFKSSSVANFSRVFLLGFYMKLISGSTLPDKSIIPSFDDLASLSPMVAANSQSKVVKLDFIILLLWHLCTFLGKDFVRQKLGEGVSYQEMIKKLTDIQNEVLVANMLNYGASIGEEEIFCSRMV